MVSWLHCCGLWWGSVGLVERAGHLWRWGAERGWVGEEGTCMIPDTSHCPSTAHDMVRALMTQRFP